MSDQTWIWEIRNPDGGSLGLEFAKGMTAPSSRVWAHALPDRIDVMVSDPDGRVVARGEGLRDEASTPMAELVVDGGSVARTNRWPGDPDLGAPVILGGGEVGVLDRWWNADDGSEWRWTVTFHNRIRTEG